MIEAISIKVDGLTRLMLGAASEDKDKAKSRKENRRETWAPGLGKQSFHLLNVFSISFPVSSYLTRYQYIRDFWDLKLANQQRNSTYSVPFSWNAQSPKTQLHCSRIPIIMQVFLFFIYWPSDTHQHAFTGIYPFDMFSLVKVALQRPSLQPSVTDIEVDSDPCSFRNKRLSLN